MTVTEDRELREWVEAWQSETVSSTTAAGLQDLVRRRSRALKWWAVCEGLIAGVIVAFVGWRAVVDPDPRERLAMLLLALIGIGGLAYSWWNWRGVWRASAQTTAAFLSVSMARAKRWERGVRAGWVILVAELAVFIPWIRHRLYGNGVVPDVWSERFAWTWLIAFTTAAIVGLLLSRRSIRREQQRLAAFARELELPL